MARKTPAPPGAPGGPGDAPGLDEGHEGEQQETFRLLRELGSLSKGDGGVERLAELAKFTEGSSERLVRLRRLRLWLGAGAALAGVGAVVAMWLSALAYGKPELAMSLLNVVSGLAAGALGGYGLGAASGRSKEGKR